MTHFWPHAVDGSNQQHNVNAIHNSHLCQATKFMNTRPIKFVNVLIN